MDWGQSSCVRYSQWNQMNTWTKLKLLYLMPNCFNMDCVLCVFMCFCYYCTKTPYSTFRWLCQMVSIRSSFFVLYPVGFMIWAVFMSILPIQQCNILALLQFSLCLNLKHCKIFYLICKVLKTKTGFYNDIYFNVTDFG